MMTYGLTKKEAEAFRFIDRFLRRTGGISPTLEELREGMGIKSKSGAHRMLQRLEERGHIRRLPNRARAITIVRAPQFCPHCGSDLRAKPD